MNKREECLRRACEIVNGQRERSYGTPEDNFKVIAEMWSGYLNVDISSVDVAMMMSILKIARIRGGNYTEDSFIDLAGYAACGYEIATGYGVSDKDCNGCFGASFGDCATCDISDVNCYEQCKDYYVGTKEQFETKSKRLQLLIRPSTYDAIKNKSDQTGESVNELINKALEDAYLSPFIR